MQSATINLSAAFVPIGGWMRSARLSVLSFMTLIAAGASGCGEVASDDIVSVDVQASVNADSIAPNVVLTSPTNQWQWFNMPGTECGNGTQTGVAVNKGTGTDVVVWMSGGGFCYDEASCSFQLPFDLPQKGLAANVLTGFDSARFTSMRPWLDTIGVLNRNSATNPYKNSTFVFIPYCTGDLHTGNTTQQWSNNQTMRFSGRKNLDVLFPQIAASFPNPSRVTLYGESAGAFGATINFHRLKSLYPNKRVDLFADAGPLTSNIQVLAFGQPIWGSASAWPAGCTNCSNDFNKIYPYLSTTYPTSRFAYSIYSHDATINIGGWMDPVAWGNAVSALQMNVINPLSNARYFSPGGVNHVVSQQGMTVTANYMQLGTWLNQMVTDSPNWSSHANWGTTCKGATNAVTGIVEQKYVQLGACGSVLGRPTQAAGFLPGGGQFGLFINGTSNGAIYSANGSPNAFEVHGAIKDYWAARGSELGTYGFPVTDQIPAGTTGAKNHFTGGGIFTSAATGTVGVIGAIWAKYAGMGDASSALGLPITEEYPTGFMNFDRVQQFKNGIIYWSAPSGAIAYLN